MHDLDQSLDPIYASGGKGSMRYFFLHGGYSRLPFPDDVSVEAKVLVSNGFGKIVFDNNPDQPTSQYRFINRALDSVDGRQDAYVPARVLVETLLKNVSIPTLLLAEIPPVLLTLGRTGLDQASFQDYEYLKSMLHGLVPRFTTAIFRFSDAYLPGDARNLSREVAGLMMPAAAKKDDGDLKDLRGFLAVYAKRYVHEALTEEEVLERCLLHVLKMPFELRSSVRYGLIVH
ncbi:uncharacterized protein BO97DRAFT_350025 [Aspergillus homomorphus CBS 101889]|uniref:Uncharacterized protein n=1 Tax=Aspergillus homomorphus (strain CBS 101889) TaxID=1450537 RepID=A0A395HTL9_ASPHC|nr:hypothetical protein BO97DRAFT_350025 [Aspergillus homomorphus CBS 101889]RAL10168.1 hypothetical protein BO97DRAFT_350025 [Aspergillus homomorphus CBS 101889]